MSDDSVQIAGSTAGSDAARDWQAIRDAGDIQFAPLAPAQPSPPPDWLRRLSEWLADLLRPLGESLGLQWGLVQNILIALAVLAGLWLGWRLLAPLVAAWRGRSATEAEPGWAPDRAAAIALLEDADRLAGQGRYAEAVHLLLRRSVHHIAESRPEWLHPASTAREIAALPLLPARARHAFTQIAARVETSLFALRELGASDWQVARGAYADFALADLNGPDPAGREAPA